jgi:hypothetical protein
MPRQLKCPKCGTVNTIADGGRPVCAACGFGGAPGAAPQAGAAPAAQPQWGAAPAGPAAWPAPQGGPAGYPAAQKTSGLAIGALICGIAALCVPYAGLLIGIAAIILGVVARGKIKKDPTQKGEGMALTGLILGIVGLVLWALVLIFFATLVASVLGMCAEDPTLCEDPNTGAPLVSGDGLRADALMFLAVLPVPGASRLALRLA